MTTIERACWAVAAAVLLASSAGAELIGDNVLIEQNRTALGTIRDDLVTVVAGTPEVSCPGAYELCGANIPGSTHGNFDIEATTLTLNVGPDGGSSVFVNDTFNGFIFSDLDLASTDPVTSVSLTTDIPGLDLSRVSFTADSVAVNLANLTVDPGQFFTVEINPAGPGLIDDEVLIEQNRTALGTIRDDLVIVVAGSPEVSCPGVYELCGANIPGSTHGNFDIEAMTLTLNVGPVAGSTVFVNDTFNGYIFSDLDLADGEPITQVTLSTDIPGLDLSRVSFTADSVAVNLANLTVDPGQYFTVPEPTRPLQLVSGVALVLLLARWRRTRCTPSS